MCGYNTRRKRNGTNRRTTISRSRTETKRRWGTGIFMYDGFNINRDRTGYRRRKTMVRTRKTIKTTYGSGTFIRWRFNM